MPMNIAIVRAGYVDLVTGACFTEREYEVVCLNVDKDIFY
jgi:UDP-glucose 6-dehydrogenase